jgi:hypothetical protein
MQSSTPHLLSDDPRLGLPTLHPLCLGAVNMMFRDPTLIVRLLRHCPSGDRWSITSNNQHLILGTNSTFRSSRRALGTLAALASAPCLWEEGLDPCLVNKVESSRENGKEKEVEEDANYWLAYGRIAELGNGTIHLRVEDTRGGLHHRHRLIECLKLVDLPLLTGNDSNEIERQILWVQIRDKVVWQARALTRRHLDIVSRAGQVPHHRSPRR